MMQKPPRKDLCELAAKLWRLKLGTPHDNGADDPSSMMANMLATNMGKRTELTDEKLDAFEALLVPKMLQARKYDHSTDGPAFKVIPPEELKEDKWYSYGNELGCDYGPDGVLGETVAELGFNSHVCPCKCWVKVSQFNVTSSFGYAAPHINYYPLGGGRVLINEMYSTNEDDVERMLELARGGHAVGRIAESVDELLTSPQLTPAH